MPENSLVKCVICNENILFDDGISKCKKCKTTNILLGFGHEDVIAKERESLINIPPSIAIGRLLRETDRLVTTNYQFINRGLLEKEPFLDGLTNSACLNIGFEVDAVERTLSFWPPWKTVEKSITRLRCLLVISFEEHPFVLYVVGSKYLEEANRIKDFVYDNLGYRLILRLEKP